MYFDELKPVMAVGITCREPTKIGWLKPVYADDVLKGKATISRLEKRSKKMVLLKFL